MHFVLAHFIGDFLLQSDKMAMRKKHSHKWCTIHVALYMLPFFLVDCTPVQAVLIAAQHWIQDRYGFISWYCSKAGIFQIEKTLKGLPWGHFIVDQVFHFIWLWIVFEHI